LLAAVGEGIRYDGCGKGIKIFFLKEKINYRLDIKCE
jgi:hypothetical protein